MHMLTVLAYIIVLLPISTIIVTIGMLGLGFPLALLLAWAPARARTITCEFCGGIAGEVLGVGFAWLVFRWLVGPGSFGLIQFFVSAIVLLLPILNDSKKARQLTGIWVEMDQDTRNILPRLGVSMASPIGETIGLIAGGVLFVYVLN